MVARIEYTEESQARIIIEQQALGNTLVEIQKHNDGNYLVFAEPTDDLRTKREKWIDACPGFADLDDFKNWLRKEPQGKSRHDVAGKDKTK